VRFIWYGATFFATFTDTSFLSIFIITIEEIRLREELFERNSEAGRHQAS